MKKILILMLFLLSTAVFSETLERVEYNEGVFKGTIRENRQIDIKTAKGNGGKVLIVRLPNVDRNNAVFRSPKDSYLDSVSIVTKGNDTTMYFFLKDGTDYTLYNSKREFKIEFSNTGRGTVTGREDSRKQDPIRGSGRDTSTDTRVKPSEGEDSRTSRLPSKKGTYTIVVDAGHGGHDAGAIGNGYREKDLALAVALKLEQELGKDYNVIMTRRTDVFKTLQERPEMGNNRYADLFVSIHLNSSSSSSANGTEVYYYEKKDSGNYSSDVAKFENNGNSSIAVSDYALKEVNYRMNQHRSSALATDVLNGLLNNFSLRDRGVKTANFAVLRGSNSPSILIELGFMSNYGDVSQFAESYDQERAARSIADAIRSNFLLK